MIKGRTSCSCSSVDKVIGGNVRIKEVKFMNTFECEIYIFGANRTIYIKTDHTLEEIKNDWRLKEKLISEVLLEMMEIQSFIEQV